MIDSVPYILNLACVAMGSKYTTAQRGRARRLLSNLWEPDDWTDSKTWKQNARAACPDWKEV